MLSNDRQLIYDLTFINANFMKLNRDYNQTTNYIVCDIQDAINIPHKIVQKTHSILQKNWILHWPQLLNAVLDLTICCLQVS